MRETVTRLLSGIVYILLLPAAIFYSPASFLLLFGIFLLLAVFEFSNLVQLQKPVPIIVAVSAYLLFALFPADGFTLFLLLLATLFVSARCIDFLFSEQKPKYDSLSKYVFLVGYIILPFILLTKIPFQEGFYEPKVIFCIFILIWTNDTFAFIVGKTMGQNKLFEKISPKKTIEGFIGGVGFAILAAAIISRYYIFQDLYVWVIVAVIVGVIGTIGDLVESKFKRTAGVKDSGKVMPGHGGILDRLDSVIFAAPFVFLFYQILNYVS
ncbi:MAG: phosphatidate cytidylyltransferase [Flavobacterium sp.]|nr:MAG: phosphatidate cytidylyltransferase [Flavobacterium sp.]